MNTQEDHMKQNKLVAPVLKWVGGKRQLLETFTPLLPSRITTYCEPFLGGGALLFHLQPKTAYINDINPDLIRVYTVIKNDVEALIAELGKYGNAPEGSADIIGFPLIHVEVKRNEHLDIDDALAQSTRDSEKTDYGIPIVLHRKNNAKWKVTMDAHDCFTIYREWLAGQEVKEK